jgi:hypothetical protein
VVKLAGLVDGMAAALQVAPSRVRTAAAQLRKHKLIQSGPRGPGALEMNPRDAANLLLALLYDGELSDAHETVSRLRLAPMIRVSGRHWGEEEPDRETLPRNGWITDRAGQALNLGELIETMLDWWVRYGHLYEAGEDGEDDIDLEPVNIRLEVSTPGYRAALSFNTPCSIFWILHYEWKSPEQTEYEAANTGKKFVRRWDALHGPHLWSSRTVSEDSLHRVAECLRGCEWDDAWEEFAPSYDVAVKRELETA